MSKFLNFGASKNHFAFGVVDAAGQPYLRNLPIAEDRASLDMLVSYLNDMPPQPGGKYEKPFEVVPLSWNKEGK